MKMRPLVVIGLILAVLGLVALAVPSITFFTTERVADIELPVLSGYEVAGRLRQQPGLENVLLVATTGHAEEEVQWHAHDAGFDAHLAKPYQVDTVLRFLTHGRPGGYAAQRASAAPSEEPPFVGTVQGQAIPPSHGYSVWIGAALILLGVIANILSAVQHVRTLDRLKRGEQNLPSTWSLSLIMTGTLAALGVVMTVYLIVSAN